MSPDKKSGYFAVVSAWLAVKITWLWQKFWLSADKPEVRYAGWVARFTFILCIVGLIQGWTLISSERSFVFPDRVEFPDKLNGSGDTPRISLVISIKNSGKSPAKIETLVASVTHKLDPNPEYDSDRERYAFSPIPAGVAIEQNFGFGVWPRPTMLKVKSGEMPFYIFGRIEYSDGSISIMPNRVSQFCFRYIAEQPEISGPRFSNCREPPYTYTK